MYHTLIVYSFLSDWLQQDSRGSNEILVLFRGSHPEVFLRKGINMQIIRTSVWVFSCKFASYFQNTFS